MMVLRYLARRLPLLLVLVVVGLAVWRHTAILDWAKLRNYQPPASISQLATEDTMTPTATHIYYVNHPQLVSSNLAFSQNCPQPEKTIVLGCYHSGENGIFLRNVTDSRLGGVEEVTAAHEMLHAAYERLSSKDKNYVDGMLNDYYKSGLSDQRLVGIINAYKQSEPNDVVDEMHSVFGTEIADLPAPLESYYARYFINRGAITAFAAGYEAEFTSRLDKIQSLEAELNDLKQQISTEQTDLSSRAAQLQASRSDLDSLRSSGQIGQYNSRVTNFNQAVDSYNIGISQLKSDIATYNSLVETHNQLADELRALYASEGTSLSAQSSQ